MVGLFDEDKVLDMIRDELNKRPLFAQELENHKDAVSRIVRENFIQDDFMRIKQIPDLFKQVTDIGHTEKVLHDSFADMRDTIDGIKKTLDLQVGKIFKIKSDQENCGKELEANNKVFD